MSPGKRYSVVVVGASGFAGAELIRRLVIHPHVELTRVGAIDHVGQPIAAALPHLEGMTDLVFENVPAAEMARDADVLIMGLPHQASLDAVRGLTGTNVRILDLSGAFRLSDRAAFEKFYGQPHDAPELLDEFVYGLPELNRAKIRGARRVASPGCFATCIELGLLPLARAGLLTGAIDTVAVTGSSGAGAVATPTTHHPVRAGNLRVYRALKHPHAPEVVTGLESAGARDIDLSFVPMAAPLVRGILATSFARLNEDAAAAKGLTDDESLAALYRQTFANEPFVRSPAKRLPEVVAVAGSNYAEVGIVTGEVENGQRVVTCISAVDNLIKGGAGQAIQNLNLMLDLDETLTLRDPGPYP
jgi:LysW-gamma-L-alpha-aminoadipyl-6-phosphate/LysW-L-glutamyl-5-phosphate reductase